MLLRSITKHVKDQNWFAVAMDFVIVDGYVLGFQPLDWHQKARKRPRAAKAQSRE